jgi:hypothetical protein
MLDHRVSRDAEHLQGPYAKAFDRICNQVPHPSTSFRQSGMIMSCCSTTNPVAQLPIQSACMFAQVAGSDWALKQDGQPDVPDEPRFSTWEEALNNKQHRDGSSSSSSSSGNGAASGRDGVSGGEQQAQQSSTGGVLEDTFYR